MKVKLLNLPAILYLYVFHLSQKISKQVFCLRFEGCKPQHFHRLDQQQSYVDALDSHQDTLHRKENSRHILDRMDFSTKKQQPLHLDFLLGHRSRLNIQIIRFQKEVLLFNIKILYNFIHRITRNVLHEPNDAANKSLKAGFQHNPVISRFFAFSKENFHSGRSVPSVSRNSSDASSQYLKSIKKPD